MNIVTAIEVKCATRIPHHAELISFLEYELSATAIHDPVAFRPGIEEVLQVVAKKMVFVCVSYPRRSVRKYLASKLRMIFSKNCIGKINVGTQEITFILI